MDELLSISDSGDLYDEIIRENLSHRVLVINESITSSILEDYCLRIFKWNREDKDLPVDKRKDITIYLNSQGGSSIAGFNLVDVIMASKTKVKCVCFGIVASMGYHIMLACHERIAFKNSILLQHDGEISIQNSTSKAKDTMKFFDSMEDRTKEFVLSRTEMDEEFYDKIYDQEYWMYADEAKKLGCIDKIIGEDIELDDIL